MSRWPSFARTPLRSDQHRTGCVSCAVVAFSVLQQIVPDGASSLSTNHTSRSRFNFRQICVPCMVDPAKLRKQLKTHYVWTIDNNHNEHICIALNNKNSSGDEIANVNFLLQHRTCRRQRLRPLNEFVISTKRLRYLPTHQTDC